MAGSQLLADVRALMRRQRYSIHTERSYCDWIARYLKFHRMRSREELLAAGAAEVEVFLSYLAEGLNIAPSSYWTWTSLTAKSPCAQERGTRIG